MNPAEITIKDLVSQEDHLRIFKDTGEQKIDLNCCYLNERFTAFYCWKDQDGERVKTCAGCSESTTFLNIRRNIPSPV